MYVFNRGVLDRIKVNAASFVVVILTMITASSNLDRAADIPGYGGRE